jgi:hypothetical protein
LWGNFWIFTFSFNVLLFFLKVLFFAFEAFKVNVLLPSNWQADESNTDQDFGSVNYRHGNFQFCEHVGMLWVQWTVFALYALVNMCRGDHVCLCMCFNLRTGLNWFWLNFVRGAFMKML